MKATIKAVWYDRRTLLVEVDCQHSTTRTIAVLPCRADSSEDIAEAEHTAISTALAKGISETPCICLYNRAEATKDGIPA